MADTLNVESREPQGKRAARRLRFAGTIPAILYGHGEANVSLTLKAAELVSAVRHGSRVVELSGAVSEKAFIRDLQWDVYGTQVLHVDFARVSEHERIQLSVPIELRGEAPGLKEGGVVELVAHELEIECEALRIPEKIGINVTGLHLNGAITAGEVKLPEGATLVSDAETLIVHCVPPQEESETMPGEGAGAEPEVIGRKAEDEEADE